MTSRTVSRIAVGSGIAFLSLGFAACGAPTEATLVAIDDADVVGSALTREDFVPGQYVAVLRPGARSESLAQRHGVARGLELPQRSAVVLREIHNPQQLVRLARDPEVVSLQPDAIARMSGKPQGGSAVQVLPPGIDRSGSDEIAQRGAGVKVCVVDTGIDYTHPDLAPNYVGGHDFVNGDTNPADDNGHGTHVAGTIAAADNTGAVVGVAPQASLLAAKVLNRRGSGAFSGITAGVDYCVEQGAKVINMSLGGTYDDALLHAAIKDAVAAGVTVVAAAGNEGDDLDQVPHYPASYSEVITVTAAWIEDADRAYGSGVAYPTFSNYGSASDIAAPGVYVLSTKRGGGTTSMSGTSMAAPHVAGAAALYLASHAGANPAQVKSALEQDAENVPQPNGYDFGSGLLNVRSF